MPKPPISLGWKEAVRSLVLNPPDDIRLTDKQIAERLKKVGRKLGERGSPSERSVTRIRQAIPEELTEAERREYRMLHWPKSMQDGALPWEASSSALELLEMFRPCETAVRPTLRLTRWFWRVGQAAPDAPAGTRRDVAARLALAEVLGDTRQGPVVEAYLSYRPWTPKGGSAWADAKKKAGDALNFPDFDGPVDEEALQDWIGPVTKENLDWLRGTEQQKGDTQ